MSDPRFTDPRLSDPVLRREDYKGDAERFLARIFHKYSESYAKSLIKLCLLEIHFVSTK